MSKRNAAPQIDSEYLAGMGIQAEIPSRQAKPKVAYEKVPDGFFLYTIDTRATQILSKHGVKFRYQKKPQSYFVAFVATLIRRPGVYYYAHKVKVPRELDRARIEKINSQRLQLLSELEGVTARYNKLEDDLVSELQKHGLKLKPGAPLDSQLLDRKHVDDDGMHYRLHFRQSLKKSYNQEAVEELTKKYPILKGALKVRETPYLDQQELERVLPDLPANIAALIVSLTPIASFNEEPLSAPECVYCGGKLLKTRMCRHCGLSADQE